MENFTGDLQLKKYEDHIPVFGALSHPVRIKIIGILAEGRQYASELARLVTSAMEISESGKAMKFFSLDPFRIEVATELLRALSKDIVIENPEKGSK